jgi:hypothetical protein
MGASGALTTESGRSLSAKRLSRMATTRRARPVSAAPGLAYWNVEVRSGGKSVARGPAISYVMCSQAASTEKENEIRQRVACYLVLTRGGRLPPPAEPPSRGMQGDVPRREARSPR